MTHLPEDKLLLFVYGELPDAEVTEPEGHLATCADCHTRFAVLERTRVATAWALTRAPRRRLPWRVALGALAAAAMLAVVLLRPRPERSPLSLAVPRYTAPELAPIDSLLTRLEQEKLYAMP